MRSYNILAGIQAHEWILTMIDQIQWYGHGSFSIQGSTIIYINPWRVMRGAFHADIILIGQDDYAHFSIADIEKLRGNQTKIIGTETIQQQIPEVTALRPWQSLSFDRVGIKAIPAYSSKDPHRSKKPEGLGFIISVDFYDIYYAGDTIWLPELAHIRPDIAIVPIDGNRSMTVEEAAEAIKIMRPRWAIPSNWGILGTGAPRIDALRFQKLVADYAEVVIYDDSKL